MKAAVFGAGGSVTVAQHDRPEPDPGWVRIAVTAGGICGSDLHIKNAALVVSGREPETGSTP